MAPLVGDTLSAPAPGSTTAGDLYVDLQTKTIWMGVDTAVDPVGAVLISDIMSIQPAIDSNSTSDRAYTDTQVATRALTVHTHVHTDITDFTAAVQAVVGPSGGGFSRGMVVMYSGLMSDIGVGPLAGWALCDGSNGTPNLIDKFVMGAGNRPTGINNPGKDIRTDIVAAHTHNIQGHTLTLAETPVHNHAVSASGSGTGGTDNQGTHQHNITTQRGDGGAGGTIGTSTFTDNYSNRATDPAGLHAHNVSVSVNVSGATDYRGSGGSHTHLEDLAGAHDHAIKASDLRDSLPYLILAYIMKL